ncbi:hypothetical protein [Paenibacillus hemerocallicola]|uniref:hypothetical protein n=1 Tax=Paenibacillus hemerocallicola TaxID=1172614 RepID=UPI00159ED326|nr:hypothetical protein [Paenibacillus hemerocallicola]
MTESIWFATDHYMRNLRKNVKREFDYTRVPDGGDWNNWQKSFRRRLYFGR